MGKLCIEVDGSSKVAFLSEELCIGCGICVKKCPFVAITVINLPTNLDSQQTHRYAVRALIINYRRIRSSCIDFRCRDQDRCLGWWELMELENLLP
jgi:translation initiation factor RLI1